MSSQDAALFPVRAVTRGPAHHWFGYYEKSPWDATGRWMLAMEVGFADRAPTPEDRIRLGRIDLENDNRFEPFAESASWAWQTGCMLQWMPPAFERTVAYNVREGDRFAAVVHDLDSGEKRTLPRPIFCVTPDGRTALSLSFERLQVTRPGYGYAGVADKFAGELAPELDGVWRMDMETGESELVLSLAALATAEPRDDMAGMPQWVNHVQINTDGTRFGVLHRYRRPSGRGCVTRLFTANLDGSDVYCLNPNRMTSHYDWRDAGMLLAWARTPDSSVDAPEQHYILFRDRTREYEVIGADELTSDGHCSYSPDRRWILSDTYPDKRDSKRTLFLYDPAASRRVKLGRFLAPEPYVGDLRCDLHPRWRRDGKAASFDSVHDGTRQLYVADLAGLE